MKNKISEIGAISMALLYRKKYADSEMIKLSSAKKFKETIESNLQSMHSEYSWCTNYKEENDLYFIYVSALQSISYSLSQIVIVFINYLLNGFLFW